MRGFNHDALHIMKDYFEIFMVQKFYSGCILTIIREDYVLL